MPHRKVNCSSLSSLKRMSFERRLNTSNSFRRESISCDGIITDQWKYNYVASEFAVTFFLNTIGRFYHCKLLVFFIPILGMKSDIFL